VVYLGVVYEYKGSFVILESYARRRVGDEISGDLRAPPGRRCCASESSLYSVKHTEHMLVKPSLKMSLVRLDPESSYKIVVSFRHLSGKRQY
jgi:hypothetical protein